MIAASRRRSQRVGYRRYRSRVNDAEPVPERWRPALSAVIDRLAAEDYMALERDGLLNDAYKPRPSEIARWITEYPATLVPLPPEAWPLSYFGRVVVETDTWWVVAPLWTAEEGRSDLSIEA